MTHYTTHSDAQLLSLLKDGEHEAFTELYNRYWKRLFAVAANQLDHPAEAEELVQDLFLDLWNRRQDLVITSNLSSYLSVSVNYKIINRMARRHREQAYRNNLAANAIDHSLEEHLSFAELKERLERILSELPEKCKLVFTLSRTEGLTRRQISLELGIAEKTVESHLTRALRQLRSSLSSFLMSFF
jgi:RNA polymerase sigma-70 factor (ECF subfamily)